MTDPIIQMNTITEHISNTKYSIERHLGLIQIGPVLSHQLNDTIDCDLI